MSVKNIAVFIAGSLVVISAFSLFFPSRHIKKKSDTSCLDNSYRTERSLPHSQQEKTAIEVNNLSRNKIIQQDSWSGVFLAKDKVILYPPGNGRLLALRVKKGDRVRHGDILGEIQDKEYLQTSIYQRDLFNDEISMKKMDIKIALEDITRLEDEIDDIEAKVQEAEYVYDNIKSDYDLEPVTGKALNERGEEWEQSKVHYEDTKAMLKAKFTAIDEYEDRIGELEGLISRLTDKLVVKAPCDGITGTVFSRSGQPVDKKTPLLELIPVNQLSLRVQGKVPFSLDGKEVKIAFEDKQEYTGTLRIESFEATKEGGKTIVEVILNQCPDDGIYTSGRKATLFQMVH